MTTQKDKNPYNLDYDTTVLKDLGLTVVIVPDEDAESPREWDTLGTMVCWHNRYNLGDWKDGKATLLTDLGEADPAWDREDTSPSALYEKSKACEFLVLPLYLYDHSGITMNTGGFSCQWDSGQVGFIYVTPERIEKEYRDHWGKDAPYDELEANAKLSLQGEVDVYDKFLTGAVYCYEISDHRGNNLESCCGFYGLDDVIDGATEMIDHLKENPPITPLSELEQKMFKRIVELVMETRELDQQCNPIWVNEAAASEALGLGIIIDTTTAYKELA